jgi:hypothetical protein
MPPATVSGHGEVPTGSPERCIGAPTLLVELRMLFERLRTGDVRLDLAGPAQRLRSNFILGTVSLPVKVV